MGDKEVGKDLQHNKEEKRKLLQKKVISGRGRVKFAFNGLINKFACWNICRKHLNGQVGAAFKEVWFYHNVG